MNRKIFTFTILVIFTVAVNMTLASTASAHLPTKGWCIGQAKHRLAAYKFFKQCEVRRRAHVNTHGLKIPGVLVAIRACESGGGVYGRGSYTAQNPVSTASGAYQFLDTTWGGRGGYAKARYAPIRVQDQKALDTYHRSGTTPWVSSAHCWRPLLRYLR